MYSRYKTPYEMKKLWFRIAPVADVLLMTLIVVIMIPVGIYQSEQKFKEDIARKNREATNQRKLVEGLEMELFHRHLVAQEQYGPHDCSYERQHTKFRAVDIGQP